MSTRTLILLFALVGTALILALLVEVPDDESVADGVGVLGAGSSEVIVGDASVVVEAGGEAIALPTPDVLEPDVEVEDPALASRLPKPEGRITGQLVDPNGVPIPNEPVAVTLRSDLFDVLKPEDSDNLFDIVSRTSSDEDGRFSLAAHRQATQSLIAGGNAWTRTRVTRVMNGDDVRVQLELGNMLRGVVLDEETDEPLVGATVVAGRAGYVMMVVKTNESGAYAVGPLPSEDVIVGAWLEGYDIARKTNVAPELGDVTLALPAAREVSGRVIDNDTSEPVTSGEVTLRMGMRAFIGNDDPLQPTEAVFFETTVPLQDDGNFTFDNGMSRAFTLVAESSEYYPATSERYQDRTLGSESAILLRMKPRVPIEGITLRDDTGEPMADTRVVLKAAGEALAEATSGPDGAYVIELTEDLANWDGVGSVYLYADHPSGFGGRERVLAMTRTQDIELVDSLRATVRVLRNGVGVPGAEVVALSEDSERTRVTTGEDGTAELVHHLGDSGVSSVWLLARQGEDRSLSTTISLDDWREGILGTDIELELDGGGALRGTVVDNFGEPVPSALVRASRGPMAHANADGVFELRPVRPSETISVTASASGYRTVRENDVWPESEIVIELPRLVEWRGRVVDASTMQPMTSFVGQLQRESYREGEASYRKVNTRVSKVSSAPGEFVVMLAEPGRYRIAVESRDALDAYSAVIDFDGVNPPPFTDIYLSPAAVFELSLVDTLSRPVPGVSITVAPWELAKDAPDPSGKVRKASQRRRTNNDGVARFDLGKGGSYRLALRSTEWLDNMRLDVLLGAPMKREYRVDASATLELTVVDSEGEPVPGTRVSVRNKGSKAGWSVSRRPRVRAADGTLRIESLPAGTYSLNLRHRRHDELDTTITLVSGQFLPRRLVLPARGSTKSSQSSASKKTNSLSSTVNIGRNKGG